MLELPVRSQKESSTMTKVPETVRDQRSLRYLSISSNPSFNNKESKLKHSCLKTNRKKMAWAAKGILRRVRSSSETLIPYRSLSSSSDQSCLLTLSLAERHELFEKKIVSFAEKNIRDNPCNNVLLRSLRLLDSAYKGSIKYPYGVSARYQILSRVLDFAQNHCQHLLQGFYTRIYMRSKSSDDSNDVLTKNKVVSRVPDVTRKYPKVTASKATEESLLHGGLGFYKDLGLDKSESKDLIRALQLEFKLCIPNEEYRKIDSCKLAIDYIFKHRRERLCMEDFQKKFAPEEQRSEIQLQFFHTRIYLRSKSSDDSSDDLTKDQVISRVLDVTGRYPKLEPSKVTEESQFYEDLGLDESESKDLKRALQVEFKLYIPDEESCKIDSCKLAIDYIYNHRAERLCMQDFWKKFAPEEPVSDWNLLLEPRRLV